MTVYEIAAKLPPIDVLRDRCTALAMVERIIDGGGPYYTYTSRWGDDEAALMSNGRGDEWAVVFTGQGAFIRVFDHESPMTPYRDSDYGLWPGLLDGLPAMLIAACPDPECGAPAEIIPWAIAGSTNGPVPHVRTDDHVGPAPRAR